MGINLLELKLDLFCHGLRLDEGLDPAIKKSIIPAPGYSGHGMKRASLSEGRCFSLEQEGKVYPVNLAVREPFVRDSPYVFTVFNGQGWIKKKDKPIIKATPTGVPSWHFDPGIRSIFQHHGNDVIATTLSNVCSYKQGAGGCKFCALETGGEFVTKKPEEMSRALKRIMGENELSAYRSMHGEKEYLSFREVNINSGSLSEEATFNLYLQAIQAIRRVSAIPISIQICPISRPRVKELKMAGLDTISFNMEIYEEKIRKELMPKKAKLYSVGVYLEAIKQAVDVFGRNQVSSWLIAGLEPPEGTIAGCKAICENGGIPHVTAFRPLMGSPLEQLPPPGLKSLVKIYKELKNLMIMYSLNPLEHKAGCVRCGCCCALKEALEKDL
ncbi:MAG: radical SAM protein [Candidatus Omnitrophota bacterium]|jgi:hypothetical protein